MDKCNLYFIHWNDIKTTMNMNIVEMIMWKGGKDDDGIEKL